MTATAPTSRTSTARGRRAAALAAALLLPLTPLTPLTVAPSAGAATAAGSIAFIKDHNVWIARGDGSGARQLSTDGSAGNPYRNTSQSDGGLVAAASYGLITTFDQQGNRLAEIDPPALPGSGGHPIDGTPVAVAVSPDGTLIAYSFAEYCGPGCGYRTATGYTSSTGATAPAQLGTTFLNDPTWVGNRRTLQSGGFGSQVMVHDLDARTSRHWFDIPDNDYGNVDVSPDGKLIAGVLNERDIDTYRINGDAYRDNPPVLPTEGCHITDTVDGKPGVRLSDPTWGPDSDTLAFEQPDGVWTYDRNKEAECGLGTAALIIPGASDPDWSGAALSAPAMSATAAPQVSGSPAVGATLTASGGTWTAPPTALAYQWLRDGAPIAGASSATYAVRSADAGHQLSVAVTGTRPGWPNGSATSAPVKVRAESGSAVRNTRRPAITGRPLVGRTLRATPGTWEPKPARVGFQWLRDGKAIKRATRATYRITRSDRRHRLTVRVTAVRNGDRASAVSKPVTVRR